TSACGSPTTARAALRGLQASLTSAGHTVCLERLEPSGPARHRRAVGERGARLCLPDARAGLRRRWTARPAVRAGGQSVLSNLWHVVCIVLFRQKVRSQTSEHRTGNALAESAFLKKKVPRRKTLQRTDAAAPVALLKSSLATGSRMMSVLANVHSRYTQNSSLSTNCATRAHSAISGPPCRRPQPQRLRRWRLPQLLAVEAPKWTEPPRPLEPSAAAAGREFQRHVVGAAGRRRLVGRADAVLAGGCPPPPAACCSSASAPACRFCARLSMVSFRLRLRRKAEVLPRSRETVRVRGTAPPPPPRAAAGSRGRRRGDAADAAEAALAGGSRTQQQSPEEVRQRAAARAARAHSNRNFIFPIGSPNPSLTDERHGLRRLGQPPSAMLSISTEKASSTVMPRAISSRRVRGQAEHQQGRTSARLKGREVVTSTLQEERSLVGIGHQKTVPFESIIARAGHQVVVLASTLWTVYFHLLQSIQQSRAQLMPAQMLSKIWVKGGLPIAGTVHRSRSVEEARPDGAARSLAAGKLHQPLLVRHRPCTQRSELSLASTAAFRRQQFGNSRLQS
uniref:Protein kinase domain-containing protein n=1 Tax=Macrostomum lignano TaxID=282301 RepID=A0A1I8F9R4_9PLAT